MARCYRTFEVVDLQRGTGLEPEDIESEHRAHAFDTRPPAVDVVVLEGFAISLERAEFEDHMRVPERQIGGPRVPESKRARRPDPVRERAVADDHLLFTEAFDRNRQPVERDR
jgi:hypothetical protein